MEIFEFLLFQNGKKPRIETSAVCQRHPSFDIKFTLLFKIYS